MRITIKEYQEDWKIAFDNEKEKIQRLIAFLNPEIVHIGSTSVPGLCAKPIIDIQVGLQYVQDLDKTIEPLKQAYTYLKIYEPSWTARRYYCKYINDAGGHVPNIINTGELPPEKQGLTSSCNIHVFVKGTEDWVRHIAFRDYLSCHDGDREAYCSLKRQLSEDSFENMIAYNRAKNDFVQGIQRKALKWYYKSH